MGNQVDPDAPPRPPVPEGKIRICVAGFSACPHFNRARNIAHEIAKDNPELYETWFYGPGRDKYFDEWLPNFKVLVGEEWKNHKTAPICWFERPRVGEGENVEVIGGRDRLCEWTVKTYPDSPAAKLADNFLLDPVEYFATPPEPTTIKSE